MYPRPGSELWTSPSCTKTRHQDAPVPFKMENSLGLAFFLAKKWLFLAFLE